MPLTSFFLTSVCVCVGGVCMVFDLQGKIYLFITYKNKACESIQFLVGCAFNLSMY